MRNAVYGLAIGDALGVPYEFERSDSFCATGMTSGGFYGQPQGAWPDDISMTLATCYSIKQCHSIDIKY